MSKMEMTGFWIRRGVTEHSFGSMVSGCFSVKQTAGVASKRVFELTLKVAAYDAAVLVLPEIWRSLPLLLSHTPQIPVVCGVPVPSTVSW